MYKKLAFIAVALLALSFLVTLPLPVSAQEATYYIEPAELIDLDLGDEFDIVVKFRDFTQLWGWQVGLQWDPSILECVEVTAGPGYPEGVFKVLAPDRFTMYIPGTINNTEGKLYPPYAESLTAPGEGVTGEPGVGYNIMLVHFRVIGYGTTPIEFIETGWTQYPDVGVILPAVLVNATVSTVPPPAPFSPTADFTWHPVIPTIGETVTFDASKSKPGFDGAAACPIVEYRWDFDGDLVFDVNTSDPIVTWTFDEPGFYDVTLEVWAPGNYPPDVPDTDNVTKTVQVIPPPMGAAIDLFCQKAPFDGKGPDVESDAFAPQELVILYAKVTYNDDPVADKYVAFEVKDPNGTTVATRVAPTNASGIAEVEFRIPSTPLFGEWLAIATVDVAETVVADTMPFDVGWIIEILSVTPEASSYKKGETATFTLEIKNIAKTTKSPLITIVIYDNCGVPIGKAVLPDWSIEGETTTSVNLAVEIPAWAFVGTATVYANALTDFPQNDGVPFCPEGSASFLIEKP